MELVRALEVMGFKRSGSDPCCYFKIVDDRIIICLSWVDDCLFLGTDKDVVKSTNKLMQYFERDDVGYAEEYVRCKIEMKNKTIKFTQPVLLKSLHDKFDARDKSFRTPAPAGQTLQ
jgi:hypothetical protein